jgi:hypothetical protein
MLRALEGPVTTWEAKIYNRLMNHAKQVVYHSEGRNRAWERERQAHEIFFLCSPLKVNNQPSAPTTPEIKNRKCTIEMRRKHRYVFPNHINKCTHVVSFCITKESPCTQVLIKGKKPWAQPFKPCSNSCFFSLNISFFQYI